MKRMEIYEKVTEPKNLTLIHYLTIWHARTMTVTVETLDVRALRAWYLLFFLVLSLVIILFVTTLGLLSLDTSRTSTSKWRSESKVNVLLGVETNNKRRNIDDLFSNAKRKRWLASVSSLGSSYIENKLKPIPNVPLPD